MKKIIIYLAAVVFFTSVKAQNYNFNYGTTFQRVCLVDADVNLSTPSVTINFLDYSENNSKTTDVLRRKLFEDSWTLVANDLAPGTRNWTDTDVDLGDIWEYQIRRSQTWTWEENDSAYDAIGYTLGVVSVDNSGYQGQMILLVSKDIANGLPDKLTRLRKELTGDGWYVNLLVVDRASNWNSGGKVVEIRQQIKDIYAQAPPGDKPKVLFILGHVPMPRSGTNAYPPDGHESGMGARGSDGYYADIDGVWTDNKTYTTSVLVNDLQDNYPGDYKWDQDFYPSQLEMAFGRVDFADLVGFSVSELQLYERYLDRLSNYRNVADGFDMGDKAAFYYGYQMGSNDGSYRTLPNLVGTENVYEDPSTVHPLWVKNNGPFKMYMQNYLEPDTTEWNDYGMDATVYSSDKSFWGWNDLPQEKGWLMSDIRSLLGINTKCLVTLWTTTGIKLFHQAGAGIPFGIVVKEAMNHSFDNQKYEKPEIYFDNRYWWYRTHFAYNGDPTIRLFQVAPPSNPALKEENGSMVLSWTASNDEDILGYKIFKSDSEFGIYNRLNDNVIQDTFTVIDNYVDGNWYMVKAIKTEKSGCGIFYSPSLGIAVSDAESSAKAEIISFSLPEQTEPSVINYSDNTVKATVRYGTDIRTLTPNITVTPGADISPASGVERNFTTPQLYTVTSQDKSVKVDWYVTVDIKENTPNPEILNFEFAEQSQPAVINSLNNTVTATVNYGTDVRTLAPTITISTGASVSPASGTERDFTSPQYYTLSSGDNTVHSEWIVTVEVAEQGPTNQSPVIVIESYSETIYKGLVYSLDARNSYDPDEEMLMFNWALPDEISVNSISEPVISLIASENAEEKNYGVRLNLSDGTTQVNEDITFNVKEINPDAIELDITSIEASSYETGNEPVYIIDNNKDTRWSAEGDNQWILFELGSPAYISHFDLSFYKGDSRKSYFDLYASQNNQDWDLLIEDGESCGFTTNFQSYIIPEEYTSKTYRFVRLTGHMNSENNWNSYSEFKPYGIKSGSGSGSNSNTMIPSEDGLIEIYPNPAVNYFYVKAPIRSTLYVFDQTGRQIMIHEISDEISKIEFSFNTGLYFFQITDRNNSHFFGKLFVK